MHVANIYIYIYNRCDVFARLSTDNMLCICIVDLIFSRYYFRSSGSDYVLAIRGVAGHYVIINRRVIFYTLHTQSLAQIKCIFIYTMDCEKDSAFTDIERMRSVGILQMFVHPERHYYIII